jgi:hypothetical protein
MLILGLQNSGLDHTRTQMVLLKMILYPDLTQMVLYLYLLYLRLDLYQKHLLAPDPGDKSEVAAGEPQEVSVAVPSVGLYRSGDNGQLCVPWCRR